MYERELKGKETRKVLEVLKGAGKPLSVKEIRKLTDVNYNTIRGTLQRLVKMKLIKRVNRGVYEFQP